MSNRKTISSVIGSHLRALRLKIGVSQAELAKRIDVSPAHIGYIELAKRLPSVEVVESYASFFEVPLDELLSLREMTIFETVDMLGDETPPAIKNERNMILHSMKKENIEYNTHILENSFITDTTKNFIGESFSNGYAKDLEKTVVKVVIGKNGLVSVGDQEMEIDELGDFLRGLSLKK